MFAQNAIEIGVIKMKNNKYIDMSIELLDSKLKDLINITNKLKQNNEDLEKFLEGSIKNEVYMYYDGWGQEAATQEECRVWIEKNVTKINEYFEEIEELKNALLFLKGRCDYE